MTPDQETSMRSQLGDYSKEEFITLAINLQNVIDDHVFEKRGMQSSIDAMGAQLPVLQAQLAEYEGQGVADPLELEQKDAEIDNLRTKCEDLRERFDKVQALNEKFQEKLLDTV